MFKSFVSLSSLALVGAACCSIACQEERLGSRHVDTVELELAACGASADQIRACKNPSGVLFLVDAPETCGSNQELMCWNQLGPQGDNSLITVTTLSDGDPICATGGSRLDVGVDDNNDEFLQPEEADGFAYVCNGAQGEPGPAGLQGEQGLQGAQGPAGHNSLVDTVAEPAGFNCPAGGIRVDVGTDSDDDGTLDPNEIRSTQYVCSGGTTGGSGGSDGTGGTGGLGGTTGTGGNGTGGTAATLWARTLGGGEEEGQQAVAGSPTPDGGYVVAGNTRSFGVGNDVWLVKLDSEGCVDWEKSYGGVGDDQPIALEPTSDGGYVVAGQTRSFGAGSSDVWVFKVDAQGNVLWQKAFGGTGDDTAFSIQQTLEGGFIVTGFTNGSSSCWVAKLSAGGTIEWQKTYGIPGRGATAGISIRQTSDSGYIVAGVLEYATWILRLDATGHVLWEKRGSWSGGYDGASSVRQTSDGGYIVLAKREYIGATRWDFWLIKLSAEGSIEWQKLYDNGRPSEWLDTPTAVRQRTDGGFVVVGEAGNDYSGWAMLLDAAGNVEKQKFFVLTDGPGLDTKLWSVDQTPDGGYFLAGNTNRFGAGGSDLWVLKVNSELSLPGASFVTDSSAIVASANVTFSSTPYLATGATLATTETNCTVATTDGIVMTQYP